MKRFKASLIISTYNSPAYLKLSLKSVLYQNRLPDEILIADDGSGESTKEVVKSFSRVSPVPVKHIWQPDNGFRLSAIRNKAIIAASGDYIIQIDGDIIMHPYFIADHIKHAKKGYFAGGVRSFVKTEHSVAIILDNEFNYSDLKRNIRKWRRSIRIPFLTYLLKRIMQRNSYRIIGCNMAFWRDNALNINGYNENIHGWGCEDLEFIIRLLNSGVKKLNLRFSAIEYHINHPDNSRKFHNRNEALMNEAINKHLTYIPNGIIKHQSVDIKNDC